MTLADIRADYGKGTLDESTAAADPLLQFERWLEAALAANLPEPNAMTLATATPDGRPSARIVLLKGFGPLGFVFFTDRRSQKGRELVQNPFASLVFFWKELERQVRISGTVTSVPSEDSDAYYRTRPRGSQLGAWASQQSSALSNRAALESAWEAAATRFGEAAIPRPPDWGGYRVLPERIEFWQGRPSRLHDRLLYTRDETGPWKTERLSP
ncbi:MAG: pyridoxamine 5'-phosphate oxidase [Gemmatimonadota bacterium]